MINTQSFTEWIKYDYGHSIKKILQMARKRGFNFMAVKCSDVKNKKLLRREFLSMKIKNVQFDRHSAIIIVHRKTGYGRIRLFLPCRILRSVGTCIHLRINSGHGSGYL